MDGMEEGGVEMQEDEEQYFDDNEIGHLPADHVSGSRTRSC